MSKRYTVKMREPVAGVDPKDIEASDAHDAMEQYCAHVLAEYDMTVTAGELTYQQVDINAGNYVQPAKQEKSNQKLSLREFLYTEKSQNRLTMAMGFAANDERGKAEAQRFISSVFAEIDRLAGTGNDIRNCTHNSVLQACVDAVRLKLEIDKRQHAHLVSTYNKDKKCNECQLRIGYRAFIARLEAAYQGLGWTVEPVYPGDDFTLYDEGGYQTYTHRKADPFKNSFDDMLGMYACITYLKDGVKHSKVTTVNIDEINQIRAVAKTDAIWKAWPIEKAKAAVIRRACKVHFAGLTADLEHVNNEEFDLTQQNSEKEVTNTTQELSQRFGALEDKEGE